MGLRQLRSLEVLPINLTRPRLQVLLSLVVLDLLPTRRYPSP